MGITESLPVNCEICNIKNGETAILKIYHHGNLGGHYLCTECFPIENNYCSDDFKNVLPKGTESKKCFNCSFKNIDKNSIKVFKVFWYGKYGDKYMCERCVYDKNYRNKR